MEDVLSFIHHPIFTQDWIDLGLDDDDLAELELCVMATASMARGGVDRCGVSFATVTPEPRPGRDPFRVQVCYVYFEHRSIAALLAADPADGNERDDGIGISDGDRLRLRALIDEIGEEI